MYWDTINTLVDICYLVEFDLHVYKPEDRLTVDEYIKWIHKGLKIYVLKERDDKWVGTYQILDKFKENEVYFAGFGVLPDHKGKGFGKLLIEKIISSYPGKKITCKTRHTNVIMKGLLKKYKFVNKFDEMENGNYWTWWSRDETE